MTAILLGATGATGTDVLKILLNDDRFDRVKIFVRRNIEIQHHKLDQHLVDFNQPGQWKHLVQGEVLFSCLGTTLKTAGSKAEQWKVDYDYQLAFAQAASENKVSQYVLVSAEMASPNSVFFYSKMKGQLEQAVCALNFTQLDIFKPPLLIRNKTDRMGEKIGIQILRVLNKCGLFLSQKPLSTAVLARAMVKASKRSAPGMLTYKNEMIYTCADL